MSNNQIQRKFTKPTQISKHLYCSICAEVFLTPFRLFCGHTFCKNCIEQWMKNKDTCPECRTSIEVGLSSKDLLAEKIIQDFEVACINKLCSWKGRLEEINKHVKGCVYDKPPEWLLSASNTAEMDEGGAKNVEDILLESDDHFQERCNEEISKKSLIERLYTKDYESRSLLESVFDTKKTQKRGRNSRKSINDSQKNMEFYSSLLFTTEPDDEEDDEERKAEDSMNTSNVLGNITNIDNGSMMRSYNMPEQGKKDQDSLAEMVIDLSKSNISSGKKSLGAELEISAIKEDPVEQKENKKPRKKGIRRKRSEIENDPVLPDEVKQAKLAGKA